jgi:hypothetical protein
LPVFLTPPKNCHPERSVAESKDPHLSLLLPVFLTPPKNCHPERSVAESKDLHLVVAFVVVLVIASFVALEAQPPLVLQLPNINPIRSQLHRIQAHRSHPHIRAQQRPEEATLQLQSLHIRPQR